MPAPHKIHRLDAAYKAWGVTSSIDLENVGKKELPRPTIICVTPVRNEAWILEKFLQCASLWADHIVVLDQCSDDGSREIAAAFPKVQLHDYKDSAFHEAQRRGLLFDLARQIPVAGKRLLLAIDADEFLTANLFDSAEWERILAAPVGTTVHIERLNLLPGMEQCWIEESIPCGLMDDGTPFDTSPIHGPRIPLPDNAPQIVCADIKMLHYQFVDWARMKSKHRWYQCWELLHTPRKRPITTFRQYHRMDAIPSERRAPTCAEWFSAYVQQNISLHDVPQERRYRWDGDVLEMFARHGTRKFRKLAVWDVDWERIAREWERPALAGKLQDPRSAWEKRIHAWLLRTQPQMMDRRIRRMQRTLRLFGW